MKRQSWYIWQASTNRPRFMQEDFKWRSFEELFPEPIPRPKTDPAKLKTACTAKKINLL